MKPGEEILNLLDQNWYYYIKGQSTSGVFDIDGIEIALTYDDALAGRSHDRLEDLEYIPACDVKVCHKCGTAKLVILKDCVLCSECNHKQNPTDLILRNQFNKKDNETI